MSSDSHQLARQATAMRIGTAIEVLYHCYTPEGVGSWLIRRRGHVYDDLTPIQLLEDGRIDEFCDLCFGVGDQVAT